MAILAATSTAQLLTQLKLARPGDEIRLASGQYDGAVLRGVLPTGNITITSDDASSPAVFSGLTVSGSANLTFSNITFSIPDKSTVWYPFQVLSSSNIKFVDSVFEGPGLNPIQTTTGLMVKASTGVSVDSSEFSNLVNGVTFTDSTGISVSNTVFHDIRCDGVRGGGNSQVSVTNNFFTDFHPATGEHADAVQFWTTNVAKPASDFMISGNVVLRGNGAPIQGVFIRDQDLTLPFTNVTVKNNLLLGGDYNSISLNGVVSGSVTGNTVLAFSDREAWLKIVNGSDQLTVSGNTATKLVSDSTVVTTTNLVDGTVVTDGGFAALQTWSATNPVPGGFTTWQTPLSYVETIGVTTVQDSVEPQLADVIYGTSGDDLLVAEAGLVIEIRGGSGNDKIVGNGFGAKMVGGTGDDFYDVKGLGDSVVESSGQGTDWVNSWVDYTLSDNVENLALKVGGLRGTGNGLDNRIKGSDGIDKLYGLGGNDLILAGAGNDLLYGGDGNDTIHGGAGIDKAWGGSGMDYFMFGNDALNQRGIDEVMDFLIGSDKLDLAGIDANKLLTGDQAFTLIGGKSFSKKAGELQTKLYGDGMLVSGDVNADGVADFSVWVHGVAKLAATDFVL